MVEVTHSLLPPLLKVATDCTLLRSCLSLSAPLAKGVEVSGGHFGQIQGAIAHIDFSVSEADWGVGT